MYKKQLLQLVRKEDRKKASELIKNIEEVTIKRVMDHIRDNVVRLCEQGADFEDWNVWHDDEIDGG